MITPEFNYNDNTQPKKQRTPLVLFGEIVAVILVIGVTTLIGSLIIAGLTALWRFII